MAYASRTHSEKWNVYLGKKLVDSVFWNPSFSAEDIRRSLIDHDGFDPGIRVVRAPKRSADARFVIGAHGLEKPRTIKIVPHRIYAMGASSSPDLVYVTSATADRIHYKRYPFHGKELVVERWIGEDLMAQGTRTYLSQWAQHMDPALRNSMESVLQGGDGKAIDVRDYEPVMVVVEATGARGSGRANDPWDAAEQYGGVGSFEKDGRTLYEIHTDRGRLNKLQTDRRFRIVSTSKVAPRSGDRRKR